MGNAEWLITFKRKGGRAERLVIMPNLSKLLAWLAKNADTCCECRILRVED